MIQEKNISEIFPKYLFWDIDTSTLDVEKDKDIIIPRALFFSSTKESFDQDIQKLESLYQSKDIVEHLKSTKERISNKAMSLGS